MSGHPRRPQLKRIEEDEEIVLKYTTPFPLHAAAEVGDTHAVHFFHTRKHIDSFNERGQTPLHLAVRKGLLDMTALLIKLGADVNVPEKSTGRTCVHYASIHGNHEILDLLIRNGAGAYEQDKSGAYPIHLAAEGGTCRIIHRLMTLGSMAACRDKVHRGPIHYAALHGQATAIETLSRFNINLDECDKNGSSALHVAAETGQLVAIRALVKCGASLETVDKNGETPLFHATRSTRTDAISTLAELGANLQAENNKECAVHLATRLGLWQSMKQLFRCGVPLDLPYKKGQSCVHIAACHNMINSLSLLAIFKADLNAQDKYGDRPVHYAVLEGHEDVISKLVDLGADINAPGKRGDTCVHVATKRQNAKMLQLLARLGADFNKENNDAVTPLYYAYVNDDVTTAKILRRCGADINKLNKDGEGMVHALVEEEHLHGLTTMVALKADVNLLNQDGLSVVHIASRDRNITLLKRLKDGGAEMNTHNKIGLTALHEAVMAGKADDVDMLHDIGVDLDCPTKLTCQVDGMSPCRTAWPPDDLEMNDYWKVKSGLRAVHLAFLHGHMDILTHLVNCGADINSKTDDGETVFHLAALYNRLEGLKHLLTIGADRNCKDKRGRTPLHYASHNGSMDCVRLLLKYGAVITETDNDGHQPLHYVAEAGHFLLLPEFTAQHRDVDLDCTDMRGHTPLHLACKAGHLDTIIELVQLNADVNSQDEEGNAAIHHAASGGQHEVIALLASLGCSVDAANKEGKTPLHVAGEAGHGEAMDMLLLCGCNPTTRDANDNLASTFRVPSHQKQAVARRIKLFTAHHSARQKTGEILYDCKMVTSGQSVEFEKLGITGTVRSEEKVRPILFFHRTPADIGHLDIPVKGLEQILSDVYELRVLGLVTSCTLTLEVPLDGYPGKLETFFRTTEGETFNELNTSEENGVPVFVANIPIERGSVKKFAAIVRPNVYSHAIQPSGSTILAEADRRIRMEVPKGAFDETVDIDLQIVKTNDIDRSDDELFASDVINITSQKQPRNKVRITLPLHVTTDDTNDIKVFRIRSEDDVDNEALWSELESPMIISNDCISFADKQLGMYVPIFCPWGSSLTPAAAKHSAKDRIKSALKRETSVLFFYAVCPKKNAYLTVLECTTSGRFQRRKEFWENEGFLFHPQIKHSGHFPAKPNQLFYFEISGNLEFMEGHKRLKLAFNPRAYKYQSFYLTRVDKKQPLLGEISIMTSSSGGNDVILTAIPIEIPDKSSCLLS